MPAQCLYKSPTYYFLPILDRFMRLLSLFISFHSLPLSDRPMTERRAREEREMTEQLSQHFSPQIALSLAYVKKKQYLCSRLLTKFIKTSDFRQ